MTLDSIRTVPVVSDTDEALTDLQRAILRAGVQILDSEHVAKYKAAKIAQLRSAAPRSKLAILAQAADVALPAIAAGFATKGMFLLLRTSGVVVGLWVAVALAAALLAGLVASIAARGFYREGLAAFFRHNNPLLSGSTALLAWRRYQVGWPGSMDSHFRAAGVAARTDLPPQALEIDLALDRAEAEGKYFVDQLDTDPFLGITRDGETYYLLVWDETGYAPRSLERKGKRGR